jgi:lipopolysaccharide export system permease protein
MKILDRYISRQFLSALAFSLLAFVLIFVVVDLIEHLDTFIDKKAPILLVVEFYLYFTPFIILLTLPVAMLLASLFAVSSMSRHRELMAMKSAGISLYRILLPLFRLAFAVSLFSLLVGEVVIPYTNQKKGHIYSWQIKRRSRQPKLIRRNLYLQGSEGQIYYIREYDGQQKLAKDVLIQKYQEGRLTVRIDAREMIWERGGWTLRDGLVREFLGGQEKATPFERLRGSDVEETPQDLLRRQKKPEEMDYFELRDYIQRIERSGGEAQRERVDLLLKIAFPFASLIIVLFGAPLASNPRRSGAAVSFAISLFICFIYYSFLRLGQALGYKGSLPPLLAAWMGNILFGLAGVMVLVKAKK